MTPKQQKGRHAILKAAHEDYARELHSHAFRKIHDRMTGEDLVQDTFTRTWIYLVKGGKIDVMKAFLYHVLNGLIVDQYRKRKTDSLDSLLLKGFEPGADHGKRLFGTLDGKAALLLIQRLPTVYQKVMRMRYVQELTLGEMALITGQSKNALAVQAHRGLEKLRLLSDQG